MAYSDTYGQTVNVQTLIDHGARRCGKLAEELTSEQVLSARQSLGFLLSNLINRGIQYWAIQKEVIGLTPDKYRNRSKVLQSGVSHPIGRVLKRNIPRC